MPPPFPLLALLATLSLAAGASAQGELTPPGTTLHLSATGEVRATPDMATVQLGVTVSAPTAAQAMARDAARMTAVVRALEAGGVTAADIQTQALSLAPQYAQPDGESRRLTGYQASNTVTVRALETTRLGLLVDAATTAGANEVDGISFGLADPVHAQDSARRAAMTALFAKARLYASLAGFSAERLVSLSEDGEPAFVRPRIMMAVRAASTPVQGGEVDVSVTVDAVFALTK